MTKHHFRVIDGCPCPEQIAGQISLITFEQGISVESIYRGDDARAILNAHGKHSQKQLADATPAEKQAWGVQGTPDQPGTSTHELFSDGVAYPWIPRGHPLEVWMQGFDVPIASVGNVMHQAELRGWKLKHPYPSGAEFHHLNFEEEPLPNSRGRIHISEHRIIEIRNHLPRH